MTDEAPVIAIVGPTAVGKSALALEIARRVGGEIMTADSRQVYRYMDVGTAKPTAAERAMAPHHMLDLVEPGDTYTAGRYREEGTRVLARLATSGTPALVAGGTGFYIRSLLDGMLPPAVEPNPELRKVLRALAADAGPHALHSRLAELDPTSAARIHPHNVPRLVRALEIIDALGGPIPSRQGREVPALYIGLTMDRVRLRMRSDQRVLAQMESGLVEETALLLAMGYDPASPALTGFGYAQMVAYLTGSMTRDVAIMAYQQATRAYIRRQMTWFRANSSINWIDAEGCPIDEAMRLITAWTSRAVPRDAPPA
ncbi:MAG TPA: tRNA (adenosine(37)-N6)-dimethylallyltransferase MiaA [Chloroflexota bacterium]|nr:tRNA (adenosine(37)-N6)-dimethylallyltransferase MiaA [Chloroflexota bacterium]